MGKKLLNNRKLFYTGVLFELLVAFLAIVLSNIFNHPLFENFKISFPALFKGLIYSLPMAASFYVIFKIPCKQLKKIETIITNFVQTVFTNCTTIHFAIISITAGVCEELFFRGFLQGYITEKFGLIIGIILANLTFGLMHPVSFLYSFITFISGCYFSALLYFTGNLFVPIVSHATYDFLALCYIKFWKKTNAES